VSARPSHVERISLRLYSLLAYFAPALLKFAQSRMSSIVSKATTRPVFGLGYMYTGP